MSSGRGLVSSGSPCPRMGTGLGSAGVPWSCGSSFVGNISSLGRVNNQSRSGSCVGGVCVSVIADPPRLVIEQREENAHPVPKSGGTSENDRAEQEVRDSVCIEQQGVLPRPGSSSGPAKNVAASCQLADPFLSGAIRSP